MEVKIQLDETSQPVIYKNALNTYTKGDLFCVYTEDDKVHKFPLNTIFRIVEDFGYHAEGSVLSGKPMPKPPIEPDYSVSDYPDSVTKVFTLKEDDVL